jgi:tetratricopeptide (TPR) repeat protein
MVLPAPPAHAPPAQARWLDRLIVALELSDRGVLTLIDNAAPSRLREAYLRLRARAPATDVIIEVRRLAELPLGATVILALEPDVSVADLDWLNLNRPVLAERRLNVVLWCERGAAAALSQRAPDFFDWISVRVDCPPAPVAHAVSEVKRAICARAAGIAWEGPGLEETLAAVRPGRPIRRVAVASYQSMIDALTSREPGWLFLEGVDTAFHLRRLRWAMAETGRRVIVFRRATEQTAPGWWAVHAMHAPITEAVHTLVEAGGTGCLAALTGFDPEACLYVRFALHRGIAAAHLEVLLAAASDPRAVLQDLAQQSGWTAVEVITEDDPQRLRATTRLAIEREAARRAYEDDEVVLAMHLRRGAPSLWFELAGAAEAAGDFEIAVRWLTVTLRSLPDERSALRIVLHRARGRAHHGAGDIAAARADFEQAHALAQHMSNASTIASSAAELADVLLEQGEPVRARECLESALRASTSLGDRAEVATLLGVLARTLLVLGDAAGARLHRERARSIAQRFAVGVEGVPAFIWSQVLGEALVSSGDVEGARPYFERALELSEQVWGPEHPNAVGPLHDLARVHRALGNTSSARDHLERALALQRVTFGSDEHPAIARTHAMLAPLIATDGDLDGAQAMLEGALSTQRNVLGDDGQLAGAMTRRALAGVLTARGELVGAIGHLERALVTLRRIFEREDHPDIMATRQELERLQQLERELERAG